MWHLPQQPNFDILKFSLKQEMSLRGSGPWGKTHKLCNLFLMLRSILFSVAKC